VKSAKNLNVDFKKLFKTTNLAMDNNYMVRVTLEP